MYAFITAIDFLDIIFHRFIDSAEDGGFTVSPVRSSQCSYSFADGGTGFIESEVGRIEERSDLGVIASRSFQLVMRDGLVSCYHSKDKSDATLYVLRSRLLNLFRLIATLLLKFAEITPLTRCTYT